MSGNESNLPDAVTNNWISIHDASRVLGVTTSTLRRWGDAGRLPMRRTLGGHRRFQHDAVVELVEASPVTGARTLVPARVTAAPRSSIDSRKLARQEWYAHLAARPAAERMRGLGQRLLGLLIQYINYRDGDERYLSEARAVGATYGREARDAEFAMSELIQAYLFFRGSFSQLARPLPGITLPTDLGAMAELHARLDQFLDAILLGLVSGYEEKSTESSSA
ncbi:MAG TPA: helix-turn-helix domain-containing protein [Chloroflexota bacterium]|nr:helix-turn-helix domain-containing protein [Chloroflexota bacterium]